MDIQNIQERLLTEMKTAMKSGDAERLSVIRMLRSTIKNKEIDKRPTLSDGQDPSLTDAEAMQVLSTAVKQRKDAITLFIEGNRNDLADKEKNEITIIESFLPPALSAEALHKIIQEAIEESGATSPKQMGNVMKLISPKVMGKADGKEVSDRVKACLEQKQLRGIA